ncbi:helix-turn-helix transcriptional regulator [Pelagerythrobacter aerophilus]|uniref:AlpA family transcriptional regulator n=1 Tax=Pelagerythrobacter aerophilus TaxID=2306995 RepID=A0A418NF55_9SPHN|nr:AlpA family transcriptional regulator [Pelagerythrobacter aerophilus]RIV76017.1 AlpA family transcriptional regulator [Pelagerythrobacter aerophilus]RIV80727.1 AlpA family transcriptional regulator [Pelagerythrobacter aerophilus]
MSSPDKILRLREVLDRTGLSRSTLYRKIAEGTFPSQVKIGARSAGWYLADLDRWFADPMGYRSEEPDPEPSWDEEEEIGVDAVMPGAAILLLPVVLPIALQVGTHNDGPAHPI